MKHTPVRYLAPLLVCLALQISAEPQPAAKPPANVVAVEAADDARVSAMKSPDADKLRAVFSDDLRYAHSTGTVDSKASLTDTLMSGKTKYLSYDYEQRTFTFPAPGIALMTGRAHIQAAMADAKLDNVLSFLAVWREENGQWRFLAWQSCKLPVPAKP